MSPPAAPTVVATGTGGCASSQESTVTPPRGIPIADDQAYCPKINGNAPNAPMVADLPLGSGTITAASESFGGTGVNSLGDWSRLQIPIRLTAIVLGIVSPFATLTDASHSLAITQDRADKAVLSPQLLKERQDLLVEAAYKTVGNLETSLTIISVIFTVFAGVWTYRQIRDD
jgi:hypothetical protein